MTNLRQIVTFVLAIVVMALLWLLVAQEFAHIKSDIARMERRENAIVCSLDHTYYLLNKHLRGEPIEPDNWVCPIYETIPGDEKKK